MPLKFLEKNIKTLIKLNLLQTTSKENLNVLIFIRNIKQFITVLKFFKNRKKSFLYLNLHDEDFVSLLSEDISFQKYQHRIKFVLYTSNLLKLERFSNLYMFLDSTYSFSDTFVFRSIFLKHVFMIYSITDSKYRKNLGYYKFYINLDDLKKKIFFSTLLYKYI